MLYLNDIKAKAPKMADFRSVFGSTINLVSFLISFMFSSKIFMYSGQWIFPRYVLPKMHLNN